MYLEQDSIGPLEPILSCNVTTSSTRYHLCYLVMLNYKIV